MFISVIREGRFHTLDGGDVISVLEEIASGKVGVSTESSGMPLLHFVPDPRSLPERIEATRAAIADLVSRYEADALAEVLQQEA